MTEEWQAARTGHQELSTSSSSTIQQNKIFRKKNKMNKKLFQFYSATLVLFILVIIPKINCHQNPLISVCPGEGKLLIN